MHLDPLVLSRLAICVGGRLAHSAARVHCGACLLYRAAGRHLLLHRSRISGSAFRLLDQIFAIAFGMGVVSGVVMPFQFGTNWSRFSDATANIISPHAGL